MRSVYQTLGVVDRHDIGCYPSLILGVQDPERGALEIGVPGSEAPRAGAVMAADGAVPLIETLAVVRHQAGTADSPM